MRVNDGERGEVPMTALEAKTIVPDPVESSADTLVLAYASRLPAQLDHWIRRHGMRLERVTSPFDPADPKLKGPRYVLLDIDADPNDRNPVDLVKGARATAPDVGIIVITHRSDEAFFRSLTEAGARGIVMKQPYVADLVLAIDAVSEGRPFISGVGSGTASAGLSAREQEVLDWMAAGHTNRAIGERLSISVKTVEAHRSRIFKKLGASNAADAVRLAIRSGLVMP
jgi:DNA-binding NarL/FixJ family response regulator